MRSGPQKTPCPRWIRGRRRELCLQPFGLLSAPQKVPVPATASGRVYRDVRMLTRLMMSAVAVRGSLIGTDGLDGAVIGGS